MPKLSVASKVAQIGVAVIDLATSQAFSQNVFSGGALGVLFANSLDMNSE